MHRIPGKLLLISVSPLFGLIGLSLVSVGCHTNAQHRAIADETADALIQVAQSKAVDRNEPFGIETPADTLRRPS